MAHLKKRVASQKILQFLQNNKVIFFFQKKSVQSDHWRLLKKKIAKIEGVASLNIKNKRDRKEIEPLILSHFTCQESFITLSNSLGHSPDSSFAEQAAHSEPSGPLFALPKALPPQGKCQTSGAQRLQSGSRLEMVERICGLLYAPNLVLGSNSLKKLSHLSFQLKEDSNLIFIGGWDGSGVINHLDSLKLLETPQDVWKDGVSCLSSSYARPYLFLYSLLEKRRNLLVYSLEEKMRALIRSLRERREQQAKEDQEHPH